MGSEFKRLKRYHATATVLRSLAAGVSAALLVIGTALVLDKINAMAFTLLWAILGIAAGVAVGAVYLLAQRRNDLRIAEKIDAEHHLRERVQTMVEYSGGEGAMLQVQREDTERRLKEVRAFGQKKTVLAAHFLLVLAAVAVFALGAIMPAQAVKQPIEPTEPAYNAAAWQKASLRELISHVESSNMAEAAKAETVAQLESLVDLLDTQVTAANLKKAVITAMEKIYAVTDAVNSNDDIYTVLTDKVTHDVIETLSYALGKVNNVDRKNQFEAISTKIAKEEYLPTLGSLAAMTDQALDVSEYDESDGLYAAVAAWAAKLHEVAAAVDTGDTAAAQSLLGEAMNELKNSAGLALAQQDETKNECQHVQDELCIIFGISNLERPADPDADLQQKPGDDYVPSQGGYSDSDGLGFASDDQVYDYKQDIHVAYGDVITEYYYRMLQEKSEGGLDEATLQFILEYFNVLYTGNGDE